MVLDEPLEVDEDLVPSFNGSGSSQYSGSEMTDTSVAILKEYEQTIVPNIIDLNWMSEVAKSRSKPYYNKTDQNINGHIFPGIEIIIDIVESVPSVENSEIRNLISLWTIHDLHKMIGGNEDEFSIGVNQVSDIIQDLELDKFNKNLDASDYHACAVALHNSHPSKIDDSTTRFTTLRPILRLTDLITSISDPSAFTEQAERLVMKVFGTEDNPCIPGSHTVEMQDSVMQKIVNKSVHSILKDKGYNPIDIRGNGVLYIRHSNSDRIQNPDFIESVVSLTFSNMREVYQQYSNRSLLGSNIESPQSRSNYNKPPRVYDVSNLSKICLSKEEIIQRIVQATVEHQNRPYNLPKESQSQIDKLNEELDSMSIEKNMFVEGMAAMVHTFYKDVLPKMVRENSKHGFERTLEGSVLHLFNCSDETQDMFVQAMRNDSVHGSKVEWPYKYIIAQELHERYTSNYSRTERRDVITELILDRIRMFDNWNDYLDNEYEGVWDEFYTRIASKLSVNGERIMESPDVNVIDKLDSDRRKDECCLCGTITSESPISPSILSNNDFDVLEKSFITSENSQFTDANLKNSIPKTPVCSVCQFGLSARSQQINNYEDDSRLIHLTIHPMNSGSVSSITRFNKILQILRTNVFADNNSLYDSELGSKYQETITDYLSNPKNLRSITNRERLLSVTSHRDAVTSSLKLPDNSQETMTKCICSVATASMVAGVRVLITKHPQINISSSEMSGILSISDNLEFFDNLLQSDSSIENLVSELKIADRVIRIGSEVNSISSVMNYYNEVEDDEMLVGSQLYGRISHMMKVSDSPSEIVRNCVNLDTIVSESDGYSMRILRICSAVSKSLSDLIKSDQFEHHSTIVDAVLDKICFTEGEMNRDNAYRILEDMSSKMEYLEIGELGRESDTDKLCSSLSNLSDELLSGTVDSNSKILSIVKNCVKLQVMLQGDTHG